jgi:hypothetical protein
VTQKRKDGPSAAVRIRAMKRDRFRCTYCGAAGTDVELEIDHIVPVSKGGSHHISNLTTACRECNQAKGNKDMVPGEAPHHAGIQRSGRHPLHGMWLHTLEDGGRITWQGEIVGVDGDVCLVQLYSWIMGEPTRVVPMPKAKMYDEGAVRLYATNEDMLEAYARSHKRGYERWVVAA